MMTGNARYIMWHGVDQPPPEPRLLRAGPLTMVLDGMDLRYVRRGKREILRRIYVAVRDPNWGTIPAVYSNVRCEIGDDAFEIQFEARHLDGAVDFAWQGAIRGDAAGTIVYAMDGAARRTFRKNRIGLCILHPMDCAGAACTVTHVDGSREEGQFPSAIAPHQPFLDFTAIAHEVEPGLRAEVRFDGDMFEMEDQRNWTDASFKTYSTPLRLPFPVEVAQGTRIAQSVMLSLHGAAPAVRASANDAVHVEVDRTLTSPLPAIGLGQASHGEPLSAQEVARLRALRPAHLRVDLDLTAPYEERLRQAVVEGQALGAPLELALFVSDEAERELLMLRDMLRRNVQAIARLLVFHHGEAVTSTRWVTLARETLGPVWPDVPVGGGSNAYYTQLNRARPPHDAFDVVSYSINPQVHAFDDASLVETLPVQAVTLDSARQFCDMSALAVSPVTLRPRFNPDATGPVAEPEPGTLPPQVDPRQMSLFGAGWTLGSIASLTEGGATSITYYETTGWRGVMETMRSSPLPEAFPSTPGMVFPLYHVLADVADAAGRIAYKCASSDPLAVVALALGDGARMRLLLANLVGQPKDVVIWASGLQAAHVRLLDEESFALATVQSEAFRGQAGDSLSAEDGALRIALRPFAVACIDPDNVIGSASA